MLRDPRRGSRPVVRARGVLIVEEKGTRRKNAPTLGICSTRLLLRCYSGSPGKSVGDFPLEFALSVVCRSWKESLFRICLSGRRHEFPADRLSPVRGISWGSWDGWARAVVEDVGRAPRIGSPGVKGCEETRRSCTVRTL